MHLFVVKYKLNTDGLLPIIHQDKTTPTEPHTPMAHFGGRWGEGGVIGLHTFSFRTLVLIARTPLSNY